VLNKDKIPIYKRLVYIIALLGIAISGYQQYQKWLNPLDLKPEQNPKQHDGSQEFRPPIDFESSVQPAPDEDGVTRYPQQDRVSGEDEVEIPSLSPEDVKDILVDRK